MYGKTMKEALMEVRSFRDATSEGGPGSGPQAKSDASKKKIPTYLPPVKRPVAKRPKGGLFNGDDIPEGGPGSGPQKGGKKQSSADIKKAYGILNDPRYKQGNYSGAAKAIDKLSPGLSNHPDVKNAMKRANEEMEEGGPGSGPQNTNFKPLSKNHSSARMTVSTSKAKQIKSWLADNGEQYPVAIDDNGSGQITIDDDDEDGSSYAAGQAIAKKFGVKVMGEGNINEENRFSRQLKGRQREVYDLALKDIRKNKVYGEKDQDAVVDKVAGTSLMGNSLSDVKRAIQHESLDLSATGDTTTSNASQEDIVEKNINEVAPIAIAAVIARILSTTVAKNAGSAVKKALSTVPKVAKPAAVATTTTAGSPTTTLPESIENNKVDTTEGYDTGNTRPRDSRGSRLPLNKYPKPKSTIPVPSMNFVGSLTSQKNEAKLSTSQLDTLKQKYSGLSGSEKNGIQMDKLAKIMKRYPESMLDQLAALDIPMVSKVAKELLK
jgi:hypothetical protein